MYRWTFTGNHTGPGSFPPTGKKVQVTGISISRIVNGKVAEEWVETDNLSAVQQLGFTLTSPPALSKGQVAKQSKSKATAKSKKRRARKR